MTALSRRVRWSVRTLAGAWEWTVKDSCYTVAAGYARTRRDGERLGRLYRTAYIADMNKANQNRSAQ